MTAIELAKERVRSLVRTGDYQRLVAKYCDNPHASDGWQKYFCVERYLAENSRRAVLLCLDRREPCSILDLGCGFGYFGALSQALGHRYHGVDLDFDHTMPLGAHNGNHLFCYREMCELFSLSRTSFRIRSFQPLPSTLGSDFNVITAFEVCFSNHESIARWGADEWRYFIASCRMHAKVPADIYLTLNPIARSNGKFVYHTSETERLFGELGVCIREDLLHIPLR